MWYFLGKNYKRVSAFYLNLIKLFILYIKRCHTQTTHLGIDGVSKIKIIKQRH